MTPEEMQIYTKKLMEVFSFFFPRTEALRDYTAFGFNAIIVGLFAISAATYVFFVI